MMISSRWRKPSRWTRLGLLVLLAFAEGCADGQPATPEAVSHARDLWKRAGIRDYDLEWSVRGPNNARYAVTVRGGEVRKIESIQRGGARVELHSAQPRTFGVDGLFRTIEDELVIAHSDHPFGQQPGARVVMRFEPDPKLGYPRRYHRDVIGTPLSIVIEVQSLKRTAPAPKS